ncbi:glycosyltransferase family 4 protein [Paenibacillus radicis (ex Xue et al. 2023)]|uniref:Glycosyltransferase family 4 protein n=1 Tax=Paenibacillus radicis (ex Xue et al. 2023) TaxID=2972489 RepID=A0ABT1YTP8_9BACL|nr:glycosyltransferase family 4 protein [Paenibacillus radicis (ex Xue et al. 2023)]MCR8636080.1 glycosyltransferase family 4 protein [Paenibacillus radicis (ex Xue et al. 2023)]
MATSWGLPLVGGIQTHLHYLKQGLEQQGHIVDILSKTPDESGWYIVNKPETVLVKSSIQPMIRVKLEHYWEERFPVLHPMIKELELDRCCYEVAAAYFNVKKYDLLHAHDVVSAKALARVKHSGTALVTTLHGCLATEWFSQLKEAGRLPEADPTGELWSYTMLREQQGVMCSDAVISPTQWLKNTMMQHFHIPGERMHIASYGMDIDSFLGQLEKRTDIKRPEGKKVIICTARFDVVKGHMNLLKSLSRLKGERRDWVCWLAGEGALEGKLREATEALGLKDHILFLGNRHDVPALLKLSDLFVFPSLQDNHPQAVMEAQVAGVALVVSDAGGIPEMVTHRQTGLMFSAGNEEQLLQQLRAALSSSALCSSLAAQARNWGRERWSLQRMVDPTLAIYRKAMRHKRKGR